MPPERLTPLIDEMSLEANVQHVLLNTQLQLASRRQAHGTRDGALTEAERLRGQLRAVDRRLFRAKQPPARERIARARPSQVDGRIIFGFSGEVASSTGRRVVSTKVPEAADGQFETATVFDWGGVQLSAQLKNRSAPPQDHFWIQSWAWIAAFPSAPFRARLSYHTEVHVDGFVHFPTAPEGALFRSWVSSGATADLNPFQNLDANVQEGWPIDQKLDHYRALRGAEGVSGSMIVEPGKTPGLIVLAGVIAGLAGGEMEISWLNLGLQTGPAGPGLPNLGTVQYLVSPLGPDAVD